MLNKIIKPVISEKSFNLAGQGTYVFLVDKKSNKKQIEAEIHKLFKVDVLSVKMINIPGKVKRVGRKYGKRSDIKKAYVKIKPGQSISIFEVEDRQNEKKSADKKKTAKGVNNAS